jgi:hypothetical protein
VSRVCYEKINGSLCEAEVDSILYANAPGATWTGPKEDEPNDACWWTATVNGEASYQAEEIDTNKLVIFNKEDYEAVQTALAQNAKDL